jgi:hypothetical protein
MDAIARQPEASGKNSYAYQLHFIEGIGFAALFA